MWSEMKKRKGVVIALCVLTPLLLWLYLKVDPAGEDFGIWFPKCPLRLLTGLQCPSCGVQRALHSLLIGEPVEALRHNWFIVFSGLYLAGMGVSRMLRAKVPALYGFFWGTKGGWTYVTVYVAWFIIRNLLKI